MEREPYQPTKRVIHPFMMIHYKFIDRGDDYGMSLFEAVLSAALYESVADLTVRSRRQSAEKFTTEILAVLCAASRLRRTKVRCRKIGSFSITTFFHDHPPRYLT